MWTRFMDLHSGGFKKEKHAYIYIEAGEAEACRVFFDKFGHDPTDVACECCGQNYSISSGERWESLAYQETPEEQIFIFGDNHGSSLHGK